MSRDGYGIVITYLSRDGMLMLWDSGHATAETDCETCTVLDDIGESSDNKLEESLEYYLSCWDDYSYPLSTIH